MKLLLTSQGFTNPSIIKALEELLEQPITTSTIAIIPTASLYSDCDKTWFVGVLAKVHAMSFKKIDIVDISAHPKDNWLPRLEDSDVVFFTGDNASHLRRWIRASGLEEVLPDFLATKVVVGNSAGNAVLGPDLHVSNPKKRAVYAQKHAQEEFAGLGLYDYYVKSHYLDPEFDRTEQSMQAFATTTNKTLYAIDDDTALKVIDDKVEIVSEGEYLVLNAK